MNESFIFTNLLSMTDKWIHTSIPTNLITSFHCLYETHKPTILCKTLSIQLNVAKRSTNAMKVEITCSAIDLQQSSLKLRTRRRGFIDSPDGRIVETSMLLCSTWTSVTPLLDSSQAFPIIWIRSSDVTSDYIIVQRIVRNESLLRSKGHLNVLPLESCCPETAHLGRSRRGCSS